MQPSTLSPIHPSIQLSIHPSSHPSSIHPFISSIHYPSIIHPSIHLPTYWSTYVELHSYLTIYHYFIMKYRKPTANTWAWSWLLPAQYILRILSWPLYFSCYQEFSAKGGKEIFLIYIDAILDISLNILLTDNETDCLFSLYMLSKQFGVHINYSRAKPRNKWALWIYSIFFSLKVCSLDLSFNYLLIHTFSPNCSDDCNFPYKFGGISYIVRYYFLGCEIRHSRNVPSIDQYFKKYLPISILYFDGKNTDRFLCYICCNLKKKHSTNLSQLDIFLHFFY